ncbi:MAG: arsenate reductase ArsC [Bacteroidia bacterium]|nr:arsenate reductase ArsC [Bacteroidia bacterium]
MVRILILCTGNSCRSQMAHGFLQSFDSNLHVRSAGTEPSGVVNPMAVWAMKEVGIDISGHTSDSVEIYLNQEWDYVVTVCDDANETCPAFPGKVTKRLHIGFEDPSKAQGSDVFVRHEFRRIREEIRNAFVNLYDLDIKPKING